MIEEKKIVIHLETTESLVREWAELGDKTLKACLGHFAAKSVKRQLDANR